MATGKLNTKEKETFSNTPETNELNENNNHSNPPVKKTKTARPKKAAVEKKKAVSKPAAKKAAAKIVAKKSNFVYFSTFIANKALVQFDPWVSLA